MTNTSTTTPQSPRRLGLPSVLVGPRLVLVSLDHPSLSAPDVIAQWTDPWFNMVTSPDVMKYLSLGGVQFMTDKAEFPKYFADRMTLTAEGKAANYIALKPRDPAVPMAVELPSTHSQTKWTPDQFTLVGTSGIPREILDNDNTNNDTGVRRAEIGIILDKSSQGQGYTHEIMYLVLDALFNLNRTTEVEFQEAWWRTLDANVGMRAWFTSVMSQVEARVWVNMPETLTGTWVEYMLTKDEYKKEGGVREAIQAKLAKVLGRAM